MSAKDSLNTGALIQSKGASSSHLHEIATRFLNQSQTPILDLGCGQGDLLQTLRAKGHRADSLVGCDGYHYPEFDRTGCTFVSADLNHALPFESKHFSAVTAIEVIEHLENPRAFLREAVRVLKPGGTLVISTPNNESVTSSLSFLLRGYFSAFGDSCYPAHITALLELDLLRIFRELGLTQIVVSWSGRGRMPGVNLHWQSLGKTLFRGKRFSDNVFVRGVKVDGA